MELFETTLTMEDIKWAEGWCRSNTYIIACLTSPEFTETSLAKLIKHEMMNDGREMLLNRMTARYSKLRRKREWETIKSMVRRQRAIKAGIRKANREISGRKRSETGRDTV